METRESTSTGLYNQAAAQQVLKELKRLNVPEINQVSSVLRQTNSKQQMLICTVKHKLMHTSASYEPKLKHQILQNKANVSLQHQTKLNLISLQFSP